MKRNRASVKRTWMLMKSNTSMRMKRNVKVMKRTKIMMVMMMKKDEGEEV